jgi:hypothetical protein
MAISKADIVRAALIVLGIVAGITALVAIFGDASRLA